MGSKRKYASSKPVRQNPVSFEMIEEKLKDIRPRKKITIWQPRNKTADNKDPYRIVKGKVVKQYASFVLVEVKISKWTSYRECFLKTDLYRWRFDVR